MGTDWFNMLLYFVVSSLIASTIAKYDSFIGVRAPLCIRRVFLIFSFQRNRISAMAVVFQVYTYTMFLIFVVSRFVPFNFLSAYIPDVNGLYKLLQQVQYAVLAPISLLELGVCYLVKIKRKA